MNRQKRIYIFENPFSLANDLVKRFVSLARISVARHGVFRVALPGGKTPTEFYARLSNIQDEDLWQHTHIYLTDERFVGFDHPESNYGFIKQELLDYLPLPAQNVHPIPTYCSDATTSAQQYAKELRRSFQLKAGEIPRFDFVLLGLGTDGHTASLFPDDIGSLEEKALTVAVSRVGSSHRVSLALPVLNAARYVFFLVIGSSKAMALKHIWEGPSYLPAGKVQLKDGELFFMADKDAIRHLLISEDFYQEGEAVVLESSS